MALSVVLETALTPTTKRVHIDPVKDARLPAALVALHRRNNQETKSAWDLFADHRARVTSLVLEAGGHSLAILGAGNCNDLDLPTLAARFREIHLADIDEGALQRARARQAPGVAAALMLHAPIDVSGALARLAEYRDKPPTLKQVGLLAQAGCESVRAALPGTFDVVLSACVLSQLMHTCEVVLGKQHPMLGDIASAVAVGHIRSLVLSVAPGGTGILVTDVVSSDTFPVEELLPEWGPLALLEHLDTTKNILSGTEVSFLRRILNRDEAIAPLIESPRIVPPWLWRLSDRLTLLTYAWVFKRRSSDTSPSP